MSSDGRGNPLDLTQIIEFIEFGDDDSVQASSFADLVVEPDGSIVE